MLDNWEDELRDEELSSFLKVDLRQSRLHFAYDMMRAAFGTSDELLIPMLNRIYKDVSFSPGDF